MGRLFIKGAIALALILSIESKSIRRRQNVSHRDFPLMRGGFNRNAVESSPVQPTHAALTRDSMGVDNNEFGSKRLPLRSAVESIPPKYLRIEAPRERVPQRDAVERRPPAYDDDLFALTDELESLGIDPWSTDDKKDKKPPNKIQAAPLDPGTPHHYVIQLPSSEREQYSQFAHKNRGGSDANFEYYGAAKPYNADAAWIHNYAAYQPQYSGPLDQFRIDNVYQQIVKKGRQRNFVNFHQDDMHQVDKQYQDLYPTEAQYRLSKNNQQPLVVCYVESWATYRKAPLSFSPASLPPVCTHVLYAFATLHPETFSLMSNDREYDIIQGGYRSVVGLKRQQPDLKVLISVGGDRWASARRLSQLASVESRRKDFIKSAIQFCKGYGFDGVDIHWQYPGAEDFGGSISDKENLVKLLKEMREAFDRENLIVSMAVPASRFRIEDGYNVTAISEYVEWITVEGFDLRAEKEGCSLADHHAPLWPSPRNSIGTDNFYNIDYSIRYWIKRGMPASKIVLGVPIFGRSFKLENAINNLPGSRSSGPGDEGQYTQTKGMLAYFEICEAINSEDWVKRREYGSSYITRGDQWISYDDQDSIIDKMSYVKKMGMAGGAVWAADMDDFRGLCGQPWPLLTAVSNTLREMPVINQIDKLKAVGSCDELEDGLMSDPKSCASYFMCRRGVKYRLHCHEGTLYDTTTSICRVMDPSMCQPGQSLKHMFKDDSDFEVKDQNQEYYLQYKEATRNSKDPIVMCYMSSWSFYRKEGGKFVPEHADTRLCTHIVYVYASLDPAKLVAKEFDPWADIDNNLYSRVTSLRDVKVLLGLGGWTDSAGDKYSKMVSSGAMRRTFVTNLVAFLRKHNFRGIHLDWNYPKCWQSNCAKGPASDKTNYGKLIQELATEFSQQSPMMELGVAISGYKEVIDEGYDIPTIGKYADYLSLMTYDYHGGWESTVSHGSPLYARPGDKYPQYTADFAVKHVISKGAPTNKVLLGLPFYGQTFQIRSSRDNTPGSSAVGPGSPGDLTKQPGMLAYYEICNRVKNLRWQTGMQTGAGPYAYNGDQWVGYENPASITEKVKYAVQQGLRGVVAWTIDLDDFNNVCCNEPFPLLRAANRALGRITPSPPTTPCERPSPPNTPAPPITTTIFESGASVTPSWTQSTMQSTTTSPWWVPESTSTTPITTTTRWTTTTPSTTTTRMTTTTNRWTTTQSPPAFTSTTPAAIMGGGKPCSIGSYSGDPGSCATYLICTGDDYKRQQCAPGLHWNIATGVCDWPAVAKCPYEGGMNTIVSTSSPAITMSSRLTTSRPFTMTQMFTTKKPTSQYYETTTRTTTTTTTRKPFGDPYNPHKKPMRPAHTNCVNGMYYAHQDCEMFNICVNGILISQICAPGLAWNQEMTMCSPQRQSCNGDTTFRKAATLLNAPCQEGAFSPYPGDCNRYQQCLWGVFETKTCSPGLHWNSQRNNCDWPKSAQCTESAGGLGPEVVVPDVRPEISTQPTSTIKTTTTNWNEPWTPSTTPPSTTTQATTYDPVSGYYKIVCYFTNWAWYRRGIGKYMPEDINPRLCTHVVYGFAVLDFENLIIKAHDSWADFDNKFYERVTNFKKKGVKVSLALGGWNDSAGDKYSRLVNSAAARARFITQALEFLEKHNFDGLDLDWEYPKCWQTDCSKGPDSDKAAFTAWVRELSEAFKPKGLLLSAAVSASKTIVDGGYDVAALAQLMDWIAVMAYDYHGQWDKKTGHNAPLYYHPDDDNKYFNANYSMRYWISEGADPRKLVMGMPFYGQSFTLGTSWDTPESLLANKDGHGLNVPARSGGQAGEYTRSSGFLAYYEICDRIRNHGWTVEQDEEGRMGPHAYKGDQWVGYDDRNMIIKKSQYVRSLNLGGAMVWALDLDDFRNSCGEGYHPLLTAIHEVLKDAPVPGVSQDIPEMVTHKPTEKPTRKPEYPMSPLPIEPVVAEEEETHVQMPEETVSGDEQQISDEDVDSYKMVCYFTNWAWYRQGIGKYVPADIDPSLCTHILYGFAVLDSQNLVIKPHDTWADYDNKFYEKVTAFKAQGKKVLVALGGWNDSADDKYSRLVNSPSARRKFIVHVVDFIIKNKFDGLDLDWEYPVCWQVECNKGPASDKEGFAALVRELHVALKAQNLLLSAAVSPNRKVVDAGYDVPTLSKYLDWIAVMTYDYHGQWDKITGHVAPMYAHPDDKDKYFNVNSTIHHWIMRGADPSKIVLGLSLYGQSFSLAQKDNNGLNAPTYGGGEAGDFTRARGFLAYYEICERIQKLKWTVVRDSRGRMGPYAYKGDQWVSFDDIAMIRHKASYIKAMGLGGGMVWALDLDDFRNICGCEKSPLLSAAARELGLISTPQPRCQLESAMGTPFPTPAPEITTQEIPTSRPIVSTTLKPAMTPAPTQSPSTTRPGMNTLQNEPCRGRNFASDPIDCSKYYTCLHGVLQAQNCPSGLHWTQNRCDWPSNSNCIPQQPSATGSPSEVLTTTKRPTQPPMEVTTTTQRYPTTTQTLPAPRPSDFKVVCYFTNWAWYRQGEGKYTPEDIDADLCTHIVYGFAVLDSTRLVITPHDSWADIDNDFYGKVTALRAKGKKVLIAIGGWNDSLGDKYSRLVNSAASRARFITNVVEFIEKYHFDGLDLDWEYPKCWQVDCNAGPSSDKENFAAFIRELRAAFTPKGWLLSAAVSASKAVIDAGYDVPSIARDLDWIAVMTYDYHGHWDKKTGHVAPLYYYPGDSYDYFNTNFSISYWIQKGAHPRKLVLGIPLYGQSFTVIDSENRGINSPASGPGLAGDYTRAAGFLAYYEICYRVKHAGWSVERDPENRIGPWARRGTQWVSFDDTKMVTRKTELVKKFGLGGAMIWALDLDDFRNVCGCGRHPLLKAINAELRSQSPPTCDL